MENFFVGSFLISNGRLGVSMKEDGEAVLRLTRATDEEGAPVNQGICSLNPKQTLDVLKGCGIATTLGPKWNEK